MKYFELDKEEQKILNDFEKGKYKRVRNFAKEKARIEKIAAYTLQKKANISIRLTEKDLRKIKSKAIEKGIPYQTLAASIIHQYAEK
jgi:predicted DNA binding CopG/RHH family protein